MYRIREFFKTLWNHRAIIENLQGEKAWIEDNAKAIINLVGKENMRMVISEDPGMFGWIIMITTGKVHGYMRSCNLIPHRDKIKNIIREIRESIKKKEKK